MSRSRFLILLSLIACAAGGVRTTWILTHPNFLTVDVDRYLDIGRHLAAGDGFAAGNPSYPTAFRPPLYPFLVAITLSLPGGIWTLALMQVLMGCATVFLIGLAALRFGLSPLGSLVVAAVVALDPILVYVSVIPMTETTCTLLVAAWCYSLTSRAPSSAWALGLLLALMALCRPTFLPFILLQVSLLGLHSYRARRRGSPLTELRLRWHSTGIQVLCISLCLLPWCIRNGLVVDKWTPATTHGGYTLLLGNNKTFYKEVLHAPWGTSWKGESLLAWQREIEDQMHSEDPNLSTEPKRDRWFYKLAFQTIRNQPGDFVYSCLWRFLRLWDILPQSPLKDSLPLPLQWGIALWYLSLWSGSLAGIFVALRRYRWEELLLLLMILNVSLVHLFYWTDLRMRAPLIPIMAILAISGWQAILGVWKNVPQIRDAQQKP